MNYGIIRLKRQLAESGEAFKELNAQLKKRPNDPILPVRVRVMGERVEALKARLTEIGAKKAQPRGITSKARRGAGSVTFSTKTVINKSGVLVNSDHLLDKIVEKNNGVLKAYNTEELLRVVKYG